MWKRQTQPLLPSDLEPGHSTLPAAIKIIYWDLISPDETFSDICQIWVIRDKLCLEVEEMVSRLEGSGRTSLELLANATGQVKTEKEQPQHEGERSQEEIPGP
ncbi:translationally-controlled tumor protein-like isoform X1 [Myotis lucifugus]|uniref:translationally-controlled tumor protein-like isoform X1 n=1 Tax=Myotis lucifugus TaxID=59463 RepID=UPI0006D71078|nr:translationally-controlled tumor protein-like isoform X1 [Myotis lucifugus]